MDILCSSHHGAYGFLHQLQKCLGCKRLICTCIQKLEACCLCEDLFCSECARSSEWMAPLFYCPCSVCNECNHTLTTDSSGKFFLHGNKCAAFRVSIRSILLRHPKIIEDFMENIEKFLWTDLP